MFIGREKSLALLKTKKQVLNGVFYAKPHIPKLRLSLVLILALPEMYFFKPVNQESPNQH